MARKAPGDAQPNRRASPEAVAKRRAARAFNLRLGGGPVRNSLDGRSLKRRQRLLTELRTGQHRGSRRPLKPLDVLARLEELLELGEPVSSVRRAYRPAPSPAPDAEVVRVITDLHGAYGFRTDTYRLFGLDDIVLVAAGILPRE